MDLLPEVFAELKQGHLPPNELLTLVATRFIGYCMTIGAVFVKLPQILKIVRNKSVKGLSIASFELEVVICLIHSAYCYLTGMPFSSYGESVAALMQSVILVLCIYYYSNVSKMRRTLVLASFVAAGAYILSGGVNMALVTSAFLGNQVIFVIGRGMQIVKTLMEKDARQLSLGSFGTVLFGKTIRIFTSLKEGASAPLMLSNFLGFAMNGIVVLQILYYNNQKPQENGKKQN